MRFASTADIRIQDLYSAHAEMVTKIAKREHKGAVTVTPEDVSQAIWVVLFEKIRHLDAYTAIGIADLATKIARDYLLRERIDYMYFMGNFIYTPEIVEAYLKNAVWSQVEDVPDIDGRVDVTDEVRRLPLPQRRLLFRKYALGEPPAFEDRAGRKMMERALVTITNNLNLKLNQTKVDDTNV